MFENNQRILFKVLLQYPGAFQLNQFGNTILRERVDGSDGVNVGNRVKYGTANVVRDNRGIVTVTKKRQ